MQCHTSTITIITVVYNAVNSLEDTIKSVATFKNSQLKYIIIDGGSTDGTLDIIIKNQDVITHWISEPDKGVYDAMNKGWNWAQERSYILFLGAGDKILSLPSKLSPHYDEIVYGHVFKGNTLFKSIHNFKLKLGNTLHHQALLIPKTLHINPPFNLMFKIYADFDFNQKLDKTGVRFRFCSLFKAYALPGGISTLNNDVEMLEIVKLNYGNTMKFLAKIFYCLQNFKRSF